MIACDTYYFFLNPSFRAFRVLRKLKTALFYLTSCLLSVAAIKNIPQDFSYKVNIRLWLRSDFLLSEMYNVGNINKHLP